MQLDHHYIHKDDEKIKHTRKSVVTNCYMYKMFPGITMYNTILTKPRKMNFYLFCPMLISQRETSPVLA